MPLQNIIISKINEFCGKLIFISTLKELKYSSNKREQEILDYTIMYYTLLYNIEMDHETDVIKYRAIRKELLILLIKKDKEQNSHYQDFILFLIELINFGNDYTVGLRKLIS